MASGSRHVSPRHAPRVIERTGMRQRARASPAPCTLPRARQPRIWSGPARATPHAIAEAQTAQNPKEIETPTPRTVALNRPRRGVHSGPPSRPGATNDTYVVARHLWVGHQLCWCTSTSKRAKRHLHPPNSATTWQIGGLCGNRKQSTSNNAKRRPSCLARQHKILLLPIAKQSSRAGGAVSKEGAT